MDIQTNIGHWNSWYSKPEYQNLSVVTVWENFWTWLTNQLRQQQQQQLQQQQMLSRKQ